MKVFVECEAVVSGRRGCRIAVLTNGFIKKTRKTPPGEIEKAKKYRKDFLEREGEE